MKSFVRFSLFLLILASLFSPASSADALLDHFRRDIREQLDPGKTYGLYQKALETTVSFEVVSRRIETNVDQSDWELVTYWDLDPPEVCATRARVYLIRNEDLEHAVLSKGIRRLIFLPVRIGVFQEGSKVVVVFTNPELLTRVFFSDLSAPERKEMIAMGNEIKKDLVTLCVKGMEGKILTEQLPPFRNDRDIRFYWSDVLKQLDVIREVAVREDPLSTLRRVCDEISKSARRLSSGWRVLYRLEIEGRACLIGVSQRRIENQALNYSGLKWPSFLDRDPCSGIYHLTQFPIEILVFAQGGEVRVGILDQFWRMRFYLWDDPLRSGSLFLARDPNFAGRIYHDLSQIIRTF